MPQFLRDHDSSYQSTLRIDLPDACCVSSNPRQMLHWHSYNNATPAPDHAAGWGNNELQCYTDSSRNLRVVPKAAGGTDGMLIIEAECNPCSKGTCRNVHSGTTTRSFTSAKLTTNGKRSVMWTGPAGASSPVMVTARIKVPLAAKAWPAFWMLPETNNIWASGDGAYGGWCASGEIDIMEHIGREAKVYSGLHFGGTPAVHYAGHASTQGMQASDAIAAMLSCAVYLWLPRPAAQWLRHACCASG